MTNNDTHGIEPETFDMAVEMVMTARRVMRKHIREADTLGGMDKENMLACIISDAKMGIKLIQYIKDHFYDQHTVYRCELDNMQYTFECQVALNSKLLGIQNAIYLVT